MNVNINTKCKVKLTLMGYKQLEKKASIEFQYNFDENTRILTCSLWKLMHIFGPVLHTGADMLFVANSIKIEEAK